MSCVSGKYQYGKQFLVPGLEAGRFGEAAETGSLLSSSAKSSYDCSFRDWPRCFLPIVIVRVIVDTELVELKWFRKFASFKVAVLVGFNQRL